MHEPRNSPAACPPGTASVNTGRRALPRIWPFPSLPGARPAGGSPGAHGAAAAAGAAALLGGRPGDRAGAGGGDCPRCLEGALRRTRAGRSARPAAPSPRGTAPPLARYRRAPRAGGGSGRARSGLGRVSGTRARRRGGAGARGARAGGRGPGGGAARRADFRLPDSPEAAGRGAELRGAGELGDPSRRCPPALPRAWPSLPQRGRDAGVPGAGGGAGPPGPPAAGPGGHAGARPTGGGGGSRGLGAPPGLTAARLVGLKRFENPCGGKDREQPRSRDRRGRRLRAQEPPAPTRGGPARAPQVASARQGTRQGLRARACGSPRPGLLPEPAFATSWRRSRRRRPVHEC